MQVNAFIPPLIESSDLLHCDWLIRASLRGHFLYPQLVANSLGHEQRSLFRTLALPLVQLTVCCLRSEEHTSELQSRLHLVCRLLLEKKKMKVETLNLSSCIATHSCPLTSV